LHEQNVRLSAAKLGEGHSYTLESRHSLAATFDSARRHAEAEPLWRDLLDRCRNAPDPAETPLAKAHAGLGANLLAQGKPAEAEPLLRESLAIREKSEPDAWSTFDTRRLRGAALLAQGKPAEAEPLLRTGYDGLNARADRIPWSARGHVSDARDRLTALERARNHPTTTVEPKGRQTPDVPVPPTR
jgi:hypothetical protein